MEPTQPMHKPRTRVIPNFICFYSLGREVKKEKTLWRYRNSAKCLVVYQNLRPPQCGLTLDRLSRWYLQLLTRMDFIRVVKNVAICVVDGLPADPVFLPDLGEVVTWHDGVSTTVVRSNARHVYI